MYAKFASIENPSKIGYSYDSQAEWTSRDPQVSRHFRVFDTYGDGNIQHSADFPISKELMPDYLASLAQAMLNSEELVQSVAYEFMERPTRQSIEFAFSVKYKESDSDYSKQRYVSMREMKVVNRKRGEFDKRFVSVEEWMDGTAKAAYRLLIGDFPNAMAQFRVARALFEYYQEEPYTRPWCQMPAVLLGWENDNNSSSRWESSFNACWCIVTAYQERGQADIHLKNFKRKLEYKQRQDLEAANAEVVIDGKFAEVEAAPELEVEHVEGE